MKSIGLFLLVFVGVTVQAHAQDDCPAIVQLALDAVEDICAETSQNEACYGNNVLEAEPFANVTTFRFTNPGDIVSVADIETLRLSAMDILNRTWGVALMQVRVDTAEGTPTADTQAEDTVFLLFGNTQLESAMPSVQAVAAALWDRPAGTVQRTLTQDDGVLIVAGRSEDGLWLRVRSGGPSSLQESAAVDGWVRRAEIPALADEAFDRLVVLSPDDTQATPSFGVMQAFYIESGRKDAPCPEAPNSGLLIQTPEGVASITLWMDEVVVELQGTAFVQAEAGGELTLNLLDGEADVTAQDETRTATAGTAISVPLDDALTAAAAPSEPEPIDLVDVSALPVSLLPRGLGVQPTPGSWAFRWLTNAATCPNGETVTLESSSGSSPLVVSGDTVTVLDVPHLLVEPGVYSAVYVDNAGNTYQNTLRVLAGSYISGQALVDFGNCQLSLPFELRLANAP